ncbi:MAG: GTPase domain-containing protein [Armatimonadetes bacterium]|nr:GTPase domain-containing protein [Armatimonadota bacterium]
MIYYACPECPETVPPMYVEEYDQYPPVIMNAIGFRGHGKTVYFSSLFYALYQDTLSKHWKDFYTMSLSEDSLDIVNHNCKMLEKGHLPDSTPKNFPRPTLVRFGNMPIFGSRTLLFYDTGGEVFEKSNQIPQYAKFVMRATTAVFLISVSDLDNTTQQMHTLLNTYILGMRDMGAHTQNQNLLVVYTKADTLQERLTEYPDLIRHLHEGSIEALGNLKTYLQSLKKVSSQLLHFTTDTLNARNFANTARSSFRRVDYCMVSALGARPSGSNLQVSIQPRRILDPLLWILSYFSAEET